MMLKRLLVVLATLMFALVLGCGGGDDTAADAEKAADEVIVVTVHDCDGDCGMTGVAVEEMTVVDGKYYCAGCAKKAAGAEQPGHDGHDHSGHDHD